MPFLIFHQYSQKYKLHENQLIISCEQNNDDATDQIFTFCYVQESLVGDVWVLRSFHTHIWLDLIWFIFGNEQ